MDNELQATTNRSVLERVRDALMARAMASQPDHRLKMMGVPSRAGEPIFPPSRGPSLLMAPELYSSGQGGLPEVQGTRYQPQTTPPIWRLNKATGMEELDPVIVEHYNQYFGRR